MAICCSKGKVQGGTLSFGYASRTLKLEIIASTVWFKELKKPGLFICAYNLFDSSDFEEFKQTMRVLAGLANHYDWYIFGKLSINYLLIN